MSASTVEVLPVVTEEIEPEQKIYQQIRECNYDIHQINIPKSKEFFEFEEEILHLRSYWPDSYPKGVVLFIHGYISHFNRPTHAFLGPEMVRNDLAYIGFDFPGHGYSTGERALVPPIPDLVEIVLRVLEIIYAEENVSDTYFIDRKYALKKDTPLFFMGHSMGGATALLASQEMKTHNYNFKGCVFLCPALKIAPLPSLLRFVMDYFVAPFIPTTEVPHWLNAPGNPKNTWKNDDYIQYVKNDHFPQNPEGLGWGGRVRFQSGSHLFTLTELALAESKDYTYPFIMFHDPDDRTVNFQGAKEMIASCPLSDEHKKLIILEGSGHDILINRLGIITRESLKWIKNILNE
jgi:alpha-beta hydrolase superfamily lysophospholipase